MIIYQASKRASSDKSVRGLKSLLKTEREKALAFADAIVKNTYRTLMTRGMKGCYVYCTDPQLREFIRSKLRASGNEIQDGISSQRTEVANVVPLPRVSKSELNAGVAAAPLLDLRIAAGNFSDLQALVHEADEWVALPDWVNPQPGLFVAQVIGESMNRRIPNGAWCLFRANPSGTREGKIVVVQHRTIADPETGGRYTIKLYSSEKTAVADGDWRHTRITLKPDSTMPGFQPLVIEQPESDESFAVIAEMLMVLTAPEN
ncbi:DNA/RNA helicase domain-containing protein [Rhodoferax sp. GW822-FHT02A01]|uniref:S24 family peptidase n=1 Tax=Rhodoferax sp. GW822-FHT02A01 TaxID=3141537 RepID=UPI00315CAF3B